MSILGVDVGEKNIGLAISHSEMLATELKTLQNTEDVLGEIAKIISKEECEKVVMGLPITEQGKEGEQAQKVRQFASNLKKLLEVPIVLENETLTSFEAEQILKDEGLSIDDAKKRVDQLSAKLILQQYLENQNKEELPRGSFTEEL